MLHWCKVLPLQGSIQSTGFFLWRQIINMAQTLHTVLSLWSWCCAASIAMYSCCHIVGKKYCFCSHYFVSNWQASDFVSDSSWLCPSPLARRMLSICQLSLLLISHRQLDCICCLNASISGMELVMGIHLNQVLQWMLRYEYCWMHPVELWSVFCAILEGSCFDIWLHRYAIFMPRSRTQKWSVFLPIQNIVLLGEHSLDCWGVQAALEHLLQRTDIDPKRIFVFGRSLGGAVGSALTRRNPGKVELDFCFKLYQTYQIAIVHYVLVNWWQLRHLIESNSFRPSPILECTNVYPKCLFSIIVRHFKLSKVSVLHPCNQ